MKYPMYGSPEKIVTNKFDALVPPRFPGQGTAICLSYVFFS